MSTRVLRALTYLSGFCGLVVLIYTGFAAVVELFTGFGVLHNQGLWALSHPGVWLWLALATLMTVASIASLVAARSLRGRTTPQQEHLA
ncbi:MAG TPA: hypothetical protein VF116_03350 [Ktedonobacterales bacterium]